MIWLQGQGAGFIKNGQTLLKAVSWAEKEQYGFGLSAKASKSLTSEGKCVWVRECISVRSE